MPKRCSGRFLCWPTAALELELVFNVQCSFIINGCISKWKFEISVVRRQNKYYDSDVKKWSDFRFQLISHFSLVSSSFPFLGKKPNETVSLIHDGAI